MWAAATLLAAVAAAADGGPRAAQVLSGIPTQSPSEAPAAGACLDGPELLSSSERPLQCSCETFGPHTRPYSDRGHKYCGAVPEEWAGAAHFSCPHCFDQGVQMSVTCPNSWDACEVFVITYHCPGCSGPANGGWVQNLPGEGWRPSSCSPGFCEEQAPERRHPTVSLYKRLEGGQAAELPESATQPSMYFSLVVQRGRKCEEITSQDQCSGGLCKWADGVCGTSWCPPKTDSAPHAAPSCRPCAPRDCPAPHTAPPAPVQPTGAPTAGPTAGPTQFPTHIRVPPMPVFTRAPTKRVIALFQGDPPLDELTEPVRGGGSA
eukprot:TRINITY_DN11659_c0_g1_i1.p2 TRINITY_DN11659_c0_g1~~TRINITY_DN11659_c0_g1_i1.p2  ORF type:complete len:349 (+),score=90.44 TRINITY_DN11659_c0_g1_i1:88-1047(+)